MLPPEHPLVGETDVTQSEPVPIRETFTASIPGIKFTGDLAEVGRFKVSRNNLTIRRANNSILISILVMVTMFLLAVSIMSMVFNVATSSGEMNLLPLSLSITPFWSSQSPAEHFQPGVPPVGVLGDYVSFIWDELIVSISAVALAWMWILRSRKNRKIVEASRTDSQPAKNFSSDKSPS